MKVVIELFGASRDFSDQNSIEFDIKNNSTIKAVREEILDYLDLNFIHPYFKGKFGLIAPYSKDFCKTCNRLRITSRGNLRLCLFGNKGISIRHLVQKDDQKKELVDLSIKQLNLKKETHYLELGDKGINPNISRKGSKGRG